MKLPDHAYRRNQMEKWAGLLVPAGLLLIATLSLQNLYRLDIISVLNDQYGYWANAAFFAGYDWSEVAVYCQYYSYGYSLVLSLLMRLFTDGEVLYHAAVLLNALFLMLSFLLTIYCARKLYADIPSGWIYLFSLVITLYANNIVQAQESWPEVFLYFLFWCVTALVLVFIEKPGCLRAAALSGVCVYMYVVHQRSLGVLLAAVLLMLFLFFTHKIKGQHLLAFFLVLAAAWGLQAVLKELLRSGLYLNGAASAVNDYSGVLQKLRSTVSSADGFARAVLVFIGHFFYLGAATLGIAVIGLWNALADSCRLLWSLLCRGRKSREKRADMQRLTACEPAENAAASAGTRAADSDTSAVGSSTSAVSIFLFLSGFASIGVSVLFLAEGANRIDHLFYGRYMEMVIGPLLLAGFGSLYRHKNRWRTLAAGAAAILAAGLLSAQTIGLLNLSTFYSYCSVGLSSYLYDAADPAAAVRQLVLMLFVVFACGIGLYCLTGYLQGKGRYGGCLLFVQSLVCACAFFLWSEENFSGTADTVASSHEYYAQVDALAEVIRTYDDDEIQIVYIAGESSWDSRLIEYLQFLLPQAKISYETADTYVAADDDGDVWRVYYGDLGSWIGTEQAEDTYIAAQWDQLLLAVDAQSALAQQLLADDYDFLLAGDTCRLSVSRSLYSQFSIVDHIFSGSSGQAGYLVYGPYLTLPAGTYTLTVTLQAEELSVQDSAKAFVEAVQIGTVDVNSSSGVVAEQAVTAGADGEITLQLQFAAQETLENVEFRIYVTGQAAVTLEEMLLTVDASG